MAPPYPRLSLQLARYGMLLTAAGYSTLLFGSFIAFLGMFYLELRTSTSARAANTITELINAWGSHLSNPLHLLRATEMFFLVLLQFPHQFDSVMVAFDSSILIAKVSKVTAILKEELKLRRHSREAALRVFPEVFGGKLDIGLIKSVTKRKTNGKIICGLRYNLNRRLRRQTQLISLLYLEFLDLRETHTRFINLIIVGNGISLSYTLSLFISVKELSGLVILTVASVSCIIPILFSLSSCAAIEKVFKGLYEAACHLLVNQDGVFDARTIKTLITTSKMFERKEDRSFLFLGLYSITFNSAAPVSRLATDRQLRLSDFLTDRAFKT